MKHLLTYYFLSVVLLITACQTQPNPIPLAIIPTLAATSPSPTTENTSEFYPSESYPSASSSSTPANNESTPIFTYKIINSYPHDPSAFTQGLIFTNGTLYEGTGRHGQSSLRKVDLETGEVLAQLPMAEEYFGEGITLFDDKIYQLTWRNQTGFIYDSNSFEIINTFTYPTEGWGITHDGAQLIMSDGTNTLYFLNPDTLEENGRLTVQDEQGNPIMLLNELEYIDGQIYANIWQTNRIVRIDPQTGLVTAWIDLTNLLAPETLTQPVDVLNGIAYDAENGRLFVTGKLWPALFEIELMETAVAYPAP